MIQHGTDYSILCYIARLVNKAFYAEGGRIRGVPVSIGGSSYRPPTPNEIEVKQSIQDIVSKEGVDIDKAIELCLYCMRTQIFHDGNKRAATTFSNHYLISKGEGLIVVPEKEVPAFKKLLVEYYESGNMDPIKAFMKE